MIVVSLEIEMRIVYSQSLKEKRSLLRSMKEKIKNKFNVSVIEVDNQDDPRWISLGLVAAATCYDPLNAILDKILNMIETNYDVEIVEILRETR